MPVIIGNIVVADSVPGGFMLHGGKFAALVQSFERPIIACDVEEPEMSPHFRNIPGLASDHHPCGAHGRLPAHRGERQREPSRARR